MQFETRIKDLAGVLIASRGESLYEDGHVKVVNVKQNRGVFNVMSEGDDETHRVIISGYNESDSIHWSCTCDFDSGPVCKHVYAAMVALREFLTQNVVSTNQNYYIYPLDDRHISQVSDSTHLSAAKAYARNPHVWASFTGSDSYIRAEVRIPEVDKSTANVEIAEAEPHTYAVNCSCGASQGELCHHAAALLLYVYFHKNGDSFFEGIRDYSAEKRRLLSPYGLTPDDPEATMFEFRVRNGHLALEKNLSSVASLSDGQFIDHTRRLLARPTPVLRIESITAEDEQWGMVLCMGYESFPHFKPEPALLKTDEATGKAVEIIDTINLNEPRQTERLNALDPTWRIELQKMQQSEALRNTGVMGVGISTGIFIQHVPPQAEQKLWTYYYMHCRRLFEALHESLYTYVKTDKSKTTMRNLTHVKLEKDPVELTFILSCDSKFITLKPWFTIDGVKTGSDRITRLHEMFYQFDNRVFMLPDADITLWFKTWPHLNELKIPRAQAHTFVQDIISPLATRYSVEFDNSFKMSEGNLTPECYVMLKEYQKDYLLLEPHFEYNGVDCTIDNSTDLLFEEQGEIIVLKRHAEYEQEVLNSIRASHPRFEKQLKQAFLYLPFNDAIKNNWFPEFCQNLEEQNIQVHGIEALQHFRYSKHKPVLEMETTNAIDWFDVKLVVRYGTQKIPVSRLRSAIMNGQKHVLLNDGTMGVIPDEWAERYGLLLKLGKVDKNDKLRLSKVHFGVIDALHDEIKNADVLRELKEKRERLQNFDTIEAIPVPHNLTAELRPYQKTGFDWLNFLNEFKWGGILADDMGLGKTIQTLAFLQHLKNKGEAGTHIIVCPTTLIYNWENEIRKFTPDLTYTIFHGPTRQFNKEEFLTHDIVITTYGTVRSDAIKFSQIEFGYMVLDESQSIKNPVAKTTKAIQLIRATNRIALSGTPVQNNTHDLYAQFDTLNPGMLGSYEFFRKEFANPIDKNGIKEKSEQLRKLVFPFMLRRTKELVAKELPPKTETVLYCELGDEQREVYELYKNHYRDVIMKKIEEQGIAFSQFNILEGLLKLRQICDTPALLNEDTYRETSSAKLDELERELTENVGTHKALVFSQFLGMLDAVRRKLDAANVPYLYFDGSTSADKRRQLVDQFQNDDTIRCFLISLKAGGVGINLTAADYVYIVDPWWNPAVEQQAIDRTHRIGQVNSIFAYKMICKGTVEEKILTLQQRKKNLSAELIGDEGNFVKNLNKEDIEFLFT